MNGKPTGRQKAGGYPPEVKIAAKHLRKLGMSYRAIEAKLRELFPGLKKYPNYSVISRWVKEREREDDLWEVAKKVVESVERGRDLKTDDLTYFKRTLTKTYRMFAEALVKATEEMIDRIGEVDSRILVPFIEMMVTKLETVVKEMEKLKEEKVEDEIVDLKEVLDSIERRVRQVHPGSSVADDTDDAVQERSDRATESPDADLAKLVDYQQERGTSASDSERRTKAAVAGD